MRDVIALLTFTPVQGEYLQVFQSHHVCCAKQGSGITLLHEIKLERPCDSG